MLLPSCASQTIPTKLLPKCCAQVPVTWNLVDLGKYAFVDEALPKRICHPSQPKTHWSPRPSHNPLVNKPATPPRNQTKPCLNQLKPSTRPSPPQTIPNQPVHATHPAHNPRPQTGLENNWFSYVFSVFPNHRCKLFVPFYPVNWPIKKFAPIGLPSLIGANFFGCGFTR